MRNLLPSSRSLARTKTFFSSSFTVREDEDEFEDDDDDKDEEEEQEQEEQEEEEAKAKVTVNGTHVRLSGREVNGVKESVACLL